MKILYVTTISNTINAFLIPHIKMLIDKGYIVDIACDIQDEISSELLIKGVNIYQVDFSRSAFSFDNIKALKQIKKIVTINSYDAVHTHTPTASVVTRLACKNISNIKMFYTSHGFSFCKGDSKLNWSLFYPIEKYCANFTDTIITINNEDYTIAKKFKKPNAFLIPGIGLDISAFKATSDDFDKEEKRDELSLNSSDIVLCSVGELSKRKNHEVVIKALSLIANKNIKYIICGQGPYEQRLKKLTMKLGLADNVFFLGHRKDIKEILQISDIFIFPSLREGLGIAGIEAMAAGIPVISSNRHGINEYAVNEKTAITCNPKNPEEFKNAIIQIIENKDLANKLQTSAYKLIEKFDVTHSLRVMNEIYEQELG